MRPVIRVRAWATFGCACALLAVEARSAAADWRYTQWGMSPAEVKTASDRAAVDNPDRSLDADGLKAELVGPYQGGGVPFTAVFLFGLRDRLAAVTLNPRDLSACERLPALLQAHYGPPVSREGVDKAVTARWNDYANNNAVNFLDLGDGGCSIQYSRLRDAQTDDSL